MKLLIAGSLHPDYDASGSMAEVVELFDGSTVDVYLMLSSLLPPISDYATSLMTKALTAPWDVAVFVQSADRMAIDMPARKNSALCIAYVTDASDLGKNLYKRLHLFDYVFPATPLVADQLAGKVAPWVGRNGEDQDRLVPEPITPEELAEWVGTLDSIVEAMENIVPIEQTGLDKFFTNFTTPTTWEDQRPSIDDLPQIKKWAMRINPDGVPYQ